MAIYFDSPIASLRAFAAGLYLVAAVAAFFFLRLNRRWLIVLYAGFVLIVTWWLSLKPSNDRDWMPNKAKTAYATINRDQVTIQNVRNCDYRTEVDYTCQWETRSYNLANLRGADLLLRGGDRLGSHIPS
jgi:hypothetical protein